MAYATGNSQNNTLTERFFAAVARLADAARIHAARRRVYRMTYSELAGLSNRELADLGLARTHISRIAREAAYAAVPK
ncbi:MAG: DUF1127 domain-containing protein [Pseudomonadota bacterium]